MPYTLIYVPGTFPRIRLMAPAHPSLFNMVVLYICIVLRCDKSKGQNFEQDIFANVICEINYCVENN